MLRIARTAATVALTACCLAVGIATPSNALPLKAMELAAENGVETIGHRHGHHRHGRYRHGGLHWDRGWHGGFGPGWGFYDGWDGPWRRPRIGVTIVIPIHPDYGHIHPRYRASRGVVIHGNAHANWCFARYRSYRAWDNSFQPIRGARRICISPYR